MIEDCWVPDDPKESGYYCEGCGEPILEYQEVFEDNDGHLFCSTECLHEYYGITEFDWRQYDIEKEAYDGRY